ncbi:putative protein phosphatase 2C 8 [Apostasia shenzhenica]|uniref:protein-serine/threonine phosphatase n=1 Tax=Apostasia shenzhenica TaxID=1088818 RepID=A0A2I0ATU4_9ASPA|nr:putative protein phosphatase 2C 8 [Apostasia shenzhenica]
MRVHITAEGDAAVLGGRCSSALAARNGMTSEMAEEAERNEPEENNRADCRLRSKLCSALRRKMESLSSASFSSPPSDGDDAVDSTHGSLCVSHGSFSLMGRGREMEEAVTEAPGFVPAHDFYGVFDGHGGATVATVCRERMHVVLADLTAASVEGMWEERWWREALAACFAKVDVEVAGATATAAVDGTVGSTAVVAVVGERRIVVANCGDSRAVLCRGGAAVPLSIDHKPERPDELKRVEAAGGRVINWSGHRVMGVLSISRSIGDLCFKPFVISEPEVTVIKRTDEDEFILLASDGLWDVVSNAEACRVARHCLAGGTVERFPEEVRGHNADFATAVLVRLALSRGSMDNVSVVVAQLKRFGGSAGYSML